MEIARTRSKKEQGAAIIVTLWAVALLALVAASAMTASRTQTNLARNLVENAKAEALADGGVYRAIAALIDPDPARRPRVDGTAYSWAFGGADLRIAVQDEAGKIDLNSAGAEVLKGLLASVGAAADAAEGLADAIHDFADADHLRRGQGMEDEDYAAAAIAYGAKDGEFESVAELRQVPGIGLDLYWRAAPALTVHSGGRTPDPTTAPAAALMALPGATPASVQAILTARSARVDGGVDEEAADTAGEPLAALPSIGAASDIQPVGRKRRQNVFTISAAARTAGGAMFERQAVVEITGEPLRPYLIYEWRRAWQPGAAPESSAEPR